MFKHWQVGKIVGNSQTHSERKPGPKEARKVTEPQRCLRAFASVRKDTKKLEFDSAASGVGRQKSSSLPENSPERSIMKYFNDEIKRIQTLPKNRKRKHFLTPFVKLVYPWFQNSTRIVSKRKNRGESQHMKIVAQDLKTQECEIGLTLKSINVIHHNKRLK